METITLPELQDELLATGADDNAKQTTNTNEGITNHSVSWKDIKYQILSSNVAFLYTIHAGVNLAFSNLLLDDLDKSSSSWFASIGAVGTPIGAIICGPLMDTVGRKTCNLIIGAPCVGAWLMLGLANQQNLWLLYLSRLLAGIAAGLSTANLVYVSETSHKEYRSMFLSLLGIHFAFGILLTTLLKLVLTWRQSAIFYAVFFAVVALLVSKLTPESPIWLANFRSDWQAAKKSLLKLNSNPEIFEEEWRNLRANAAAAAAATTKNSTNDHLSKHGWFEPAVRKPVTALLILILLQQLSGLYPTIYYAVEIFPRLGPKIGPQFEGGAFVLFGVVRFVASVLSCCVSGKVGRKTLLIWSSTGMLLCLAASVAVAAVSSASLTTDDLWRDLAEYAAVLSFILFVGVGAVGVMTVPWTLIVELLPTEKRAFGGAALISYAYLLLFATAKIFPFALDSIGLTSTFAFFAAISLATAFFVYFFIPETLNRTLAEIESFYATSK